MTSLRLAEVEIGRRIETEPVILPLLGARMADNVCFEYIPMSIEHGEVVIAIPTWVANSIILEPGAVVDLNVGVEFNGRIFSQGTVLRSGWDETLGCSRYTIKLVGAPKGRLGGPAIFMKDRSLQVQLHCPNDFTVKDLLIALLKDSMHLKKGLLVHLNHLIPYFSRITDFDVRNQSSASKNLLKDLIHRVQEQLQTLNVLYQRYKNDPRSIQDILKSLDLEDLRTGSQSELQMDVLRSIFFVNTPQPGTRSPIPYLHAINDLERKLRSNYNYLALLPVVTA